MNRRNKHTSKEKSRMPRLGLQAMCALTLQVILCATSQAEISIESTEESSVIQVAPSEEHRITLHPADEDDVTIMVGPGRQTSQSGHQTMVLVPEIHIDQPWHHRPSGTKPRPYGQKHHVPYPQGHRHE